MNMSHANRGVAFEQLIDYSNRMYDQKGIAVINKRPTPVKILGISQGRVTGFLERPSTVDYEGTYRGRSIVFEAKSTRELNRFDLKNIHEHQVEYLEKCHSHGAISFLLVEFAKHRTVYLMPYQTLRHYWRQKQKGGRGTQSIPIEEFDIHAYEVKSWRVPLDYLAIVDQICKNMHISSCSNAE
ncbi:Holliday junction resolvase RecU [Tepidibacillus sp. LV47]|uniref:Holliday junction resolvase RecU n=1 Tax=Tepidibacillus sp. LV47 TaxID=3398228 RepID=UPI003AADF56D